MAIMSFHDSRQGARRRLFDAALVLLGHAVDREGRMLLPAPRSLAVRADELEELVTSLLAEGLVEEVPVRAPEQAWRSAGERRYGLRITAAGLKAIGVPALESGVDDGSPLAQSSGQTGARGITGGSHR